MRKVKIEESVFDYNKLTDEQLHEQLRVQKQRLIYTDPVNINPSEVDVLHDIFLNMKYINKELKKRHFNRT